MITVVEVRGVEDAFVGHSSITGEPFRAKNVWVRPADPDEGPYETVVTLVENDVKHFEDAGIEPGCLLRMNIILTWTVGYSGHKMRAVELRFCEFVNTKKIS